MFVYALKFEDTNADTLGTNLVKLVFGISDRGTVIIPKIFVKPYFRYRPIVRSHPSYVRIFDAIFHAVSEVARGNFLGASTRVVRRASFLNVYSRFSESGVSFF